MCRATIIRIKPPTANLANIVYVLEGCRLVAVSHTVDLLQTCLCAWFVTAKHYQNCSPLEEQLPVLTVAVLYLRFCQSNIAKFLGKGFPNTLILYCPKQTCTLNLTSESYSTISLLFFLESTFIFLSM